MSDKCEQIACKQIATVLTDLLERLDDNLGMAELSPDRKKWICPKCRRETCLPDCGIVCILEKADEASEILAEYYCPSDSSEPEKPLISEKEMSESELDQELRSFGIDPDKLLSSSFNKVCAALKEKSSQVAELTEERGLLQLQRDEARRELASMRKEVIELSLDATDHQSQVAELTAQLEAMRVSRDSLLQVVDDPCGCVRRPVAGKAWPEIILCKRCEIIQRAEKLP